MGSQGVRQKKCMGARGRQRAEGGQRDGESPWTSGQGGGLDMGRGYQEMGLLGVHTALG